MKKNKWRDDDVLNGFKCVSQLTNKVTDIFKCSRGERQRGRGGGRRNRLIEQIQRPALLIRLISLLPEVNYHTHTSCCCSTYIIITVARMENDPKLAIWGFPSPASHTGCKHPLLRTAKWLPHHHGTLINIFYPTLLARSRPTTPLPPPPTPLVCQPIFGLISFI